MWQAMWNAVAEEFADVPDPGEFSRISVRLLLAALLGGLLGWERERAGKTAGVRTHMLVALGAALFVLIPERSGSSSADLSRVIQGVVTGLGFLGGGAILKLNQERLVKGLTTAAGLWLTTAVGIAAGLGRGVSAIWGTLLAYLILAGVRWLEARLEPDRAAGAPKEEQPQGQQKE